MPAHDAKRRKESATPKPCEGVQRSSQQHVAPFVTDSVTDEHSNKEHTDHGQEDISAATSASEALLSLPAELVESVLACLPASELLRATLVSSSLATAAETCFEQICSREGWRFPRHPRGPDASQSHLPWRMLYRWSRHMRRHKTAFESQIRLCGIRN